MENLEYHIEIIEIHKKEIKKREELISEREKYIIENYCPFKRNDLIIAHPKYNTDDIIRGKISHISFENILVFDPTKDNFSNTTKKWGFRYWILPYVKNMSRKNNNKNNVYINSEEHVIEKYEDKKNPQHN